MTKVIILGQEPKEEKKKPIQFVKSLSSMLNIQNSIESPKNYNHIELICRKYNSEYDLMFAYNKDRSNGCLFLGHFNDGVVE